MKKIENGKIISLSKELVFTFQAESDTDDPLNTTILYDTLKIMSKAEYKKETRKEKIEKIRNAKRTS